MKTGGCLRSLHATWKRRPAEQPEWSWPMAFVDRNSKHILNRLLMFVMDIYVLLRRKKKANLLESIDRVTQEHP